MNATEEVTYQKNEQEYACLQKQFDRAQKNKCCKCIDGIIKDMTRLDAEQARLLGQPLNSRPELQLVVRS